MSVHYKFKSTLDYDTITFDGLHISVADLKKAILQQKRLSKITDFDLQIINAQTKEEYQYDNSLIPKNTSLIISRVPIANQGRKQWDLNSTQVQVQPRLPPTKPEGSDVDLYKMEGSEEQKIDAMMAQSVGFYDPKSYQKIRGYSQTGDVPLTYRCNKCKKGGHWIKNCPYNISKDYVDVKRTTGIPKSFIDKDERTLLIESQEPFVEEEKKQEIPDDLVCSICNDLFIDAVMIPCCGSSFCDDCVRCALLESEDNECPDCKEKGCSPGSLIPNRFLRNSVNSFKNRTGYKTSAQAKKILSSNNENDTIKPNTTEESKTTEEARATEETEQKIVEPDTTSNLTPPPIETTISEATNKSKEQEEKQDAKEELPPPEVAEKEEKVEEAVAPIITKKDDDKEKEPSSPNHEESDYEDNIVVTITPTAETSAEKYLHGPHPRHGSHPHMNSSPINKHQVSPYHSDSGGGVGSGIHRSAHESSHKEWEHAPSREKHRHDNMMNDNTYMSDKPRALLKAPDNLQPPGAQQPPPIGPLYGPPPSHPPYVDMHNTQQQPRPMRPMNIHPGYNNPMHSRQPMFAQHSMPPHHQVAPHSHPAQRMPMPAINTYEQPYNPIGTLASGYPRFPPTNMPPRFNYPMREPEGPSYPIRTYNNLSSVYEEVQAKVGVGIIDDPLEAFNRIMKEKEKKKDERRSPDRRRRSKERHIMRGPFRPSPYNNRPAKDMAFHHDKRARSRDRDRDMDRGRWMSRYSKDIDQDRERDRERDRDRNARPMERDRDIREREKELNYRPRRSKSFDRNSRSRSHSPKRYRSPPLPHPNMKNHNPNEKYFQQKFRHDEPEDMNYGSRFRRGNSRSNSYLMKPHDLREGNKYRNTNPDKIMDMREPPPGFHHNRKPYDEGSEPPPPGSELSSNRNPFHSSGGDRNLSPPPSHLTNPSAAYPRDNNNTEWLNIRNPTPDLYEKCVSQDLEENKMYNINKRSRSRSPDHRPPRPRSRSRTRSHSPYGEKRKRYNRSTTPKGRPQEGSGHSKKEKERTNDHTPHHYGDKRRKSEDKLHQRMSPLHVERKDSHHHHEAVDVKGKKHSMTPPRIEFDIKGHSEHQEQSTISPELYRDRQKEKSVSKESKKSEKKLKERKKRRKEKKENKKPRKEKKAKKDRHKSKSQDKEQQQQEEENENENGDDYDDDNDNKHEAPNKMAGEGKNVENNQKQSTAEGDSRVLTNQQKIEHNNDMKLATKEEAEACQLDDYLGKLKEHDQAERKENEKSTEVIKNSNDPLMKHVTPPPPPNADITPDRDATTANDKTSSSDIKCFDAVLDIHEYETDFDDNSFKTQDNATLKLLPETSKWEIDDEQQQQQQMEVTNNVLVCPDEKHLINRTISVDNMERVTNEVLVRAEKAIFARAINAIRPIELRKKSNSRERSSSKARGHGIETANDMKNIQITLPVNTSNKERSIEMKNDSYPEQKKKSIKERLGSKVPQTIFSQVNEILKGGSGGSGGGAAGSDESHRESERYKRSRDGSLDSKVIPKRNEFEKNYRHNRSNEHHQSRHQQQQQQHHPQLPHDREREREREREKDKDRDKQKERERERDHDKEKGDRGRDKDKEKNNERDKERNRDRERERERDRSRNPTKNEHAKDSHKTIPRHRRSSEREHHHQQQQQSRAISITTTSATTTTHKPSYVPRSSVSPRRKHHSASDSDTSTADADDHYKRKQNKSEKKSRKQQQRSDSSDSDDNGKKSKRKNKSSKKKKKSKK